MPSPVVFPVQVGILACSRLQDIVGKVDRENKLERKMHGGWGETTRGSL